MQRSSSVSVGRGSGDAVSDSGLSVAGGEAGGVADEDGVALAVVVVGVVVVEVTVLVVSKIEALGVADRDGGGVCKLICFTVGGTGDVVDVAVEVMVVVVVAVFGSALLVFAVVCSVEEGVAVVFLVHSWFVHSPEVSRDSEQSPQ